MALPPPVESDLAAVGERYGLGLSAADVTSFAPFAAGLLGSWEAVEELYARTAPTPRTDRQWRRPPDSDNPLGAWYVTTMPSAMSSTAIGVTTVTSPGSIIGAMLPVSIVMVR